MFALHVIQAGEQFSVECRKSRLIPIPLLSLAYDHSSQSSSRSFSGEEYQPFISMVNLF